MTLVAESSGEKEKMICPACGARMNLHAEKIDYAAMSPGQSGAGPDSGEFAEVVQEIHTCPCCGEIAARRAD